MGADLSDPNWWPKPRRQPKAIPWPTLIFGTLVPAVAGLGIVIAIVSHKGRACPAPSRRDPPRPYAICLKSHGVVAGQGGGAKENAAVRACRDKLPAGTRAGSFGAGPGGGAVSSAREEFSQCVQSATAGLHVSRSRFGGGPSSAFRKAVAVCQGLAASSAGGGSSGSSGGLSTPTSTTPSAPPVA